MAHHVQDDTPQPASAEALAAGHQIDHVRIDSIVRFAVGLVVSVALVFGAVGGLLWYFAGLDRQTAEDRSPLMDLTAGQFPPPRLQERPRDNLIQYRAEIEAKANSYGWVDQGAGVARIPIDRALEIVATKKMLKSRAAGGAAAGAEPPAPPAEEAAPGAETAPEAAESATSPAPGEAEPR
jgi:hypothetical protein